ncbi:MAG: hypothetical protein K2H64_12195 [Desulfovibrio sp.]|nr:hypothetical protein [Desulfovibrio sp.]
MNSATDGDARARRPGRQGGGFFGQSALAMTVRFRAGNRAVRRSQSDGADMRFSSPYQDLRVASY